MAPDKLFNRIQLEAQTKKLGDDLRKILQRIKTIAVSRSVVEGNNTQAAEHDRLLGELDKVEADIKKLISRCEDWIQSNKNDISKIRQHIDMPKAKIVSGQALPQKLMIAEKESEIKFLEVQIQKLKADLNFLRAKENKNTRYRYRYRVVERQKAELSRNPFELPIRNQDDIEYISIKAWDNEKNERGKISARYNKENGTVFIIDTLANPQKEGIGPLLYLALESLFPTGTILYFKENQSRLFWLKMRFFLKPFDGEQKAEYYWKRVP